MARLSHCCQGHYSSRQHSAIKCLCNSSVKLSDIWLPIRPAVCIVISCVNLLLSWIGLVTTGATIRLNLRLASGRKTWKQSLTEARSIVEMSSGGLTGDKTQISHMSIEGQSTATVKKKTRNKQSSLATKTPYVVKKTFRFSRNLQLNTVHPYLCAK